jgi:hypothetical protein
MIKLDRNDFHIGSMKIGETRRFEVLLTNESQNPVIISEIRAGCGSCTSASLDKHSLEKDQFGRLTIQFTPNSTGSYPKTVKITYGESNEALAKTMIVTFNVTVTQ